MDSDNAPNHHQNAVAGPSTIAEDMTVVFLPPTAGTGITSCFHFSWHLITFRTRLISQNVAHPPPRAHLASTQDLLARFYLHPAYDKHVRPAIPSQTPPPPAAVLPSTPHPPLPDSDDKTKKNSYRFLVKNVPGKHSMKKDDYLATIMQVPPKQRIPITEFDERTQREAFTVSADGLKGVRSSVLTFVSLLIPHQWNASTLVLESAQAKEDRKKRVRGALSSP